MTKLSFNKSPYYDDYTPNSGYHRVLYKPGYAVQGRELNSAQAIISNQITSFANHVFKNGSKVSNARSSIGQYQYVRLRDLAVDGKAIDLTSFKEGDIVVGEVSRIKAKIVAVSEKDNIDPATLFVVYLNTAVDGQTTHFIPGENILFQDDNDVTVYKATVRCPTCAGSSDGSEISPLGVGHIFHIDEGVFYFEGEFIRNARQQIIVSKYSYPMGQDSSPFTGRKIGFDFVQSIVNADDDQSLFDPSLGYPNATAPGADRYKIELILNTRTYDSQDGENFLLLAKIDNRYLIQYQKSDSDYADLMDMIAKRTYETNGNYTIRPYKISFYEHKKTGPTHARGWQYDGDPEYLVAVLTPSVSYVRGYRNETIADTPILFRKARDTKFMPSFIKRFDDRSSVLLKPKTHVIWPNPATETGFVGASTVAIFDQPDGLGTQIGTVRINDISKVSGAAFDLSAIYRYTISDLRLATGKTLRDAKSFVNAVTVFNAEPWAPQGVDFDVQNANNAPLVFRLDRDNVKSIRDMDNHLNGSLSINVRKKFTTTLDSTGSATFNTMTNEFFTDIGNSTVCFTTSTSNVKQSIDLNGSNAAISPTSLTVNFGNSKAGHTVTILTSVLKTNSKEKVKTLVDYTTTTTVAPVNTIGNVVKLGKADGYTLSKVELYDHSNPANLVLVADVTSNYAFGGGQTDWFYGESTLTMQRLIDVGITGNMRLHVQFKYFEHSGTEGFFTPDSYSDMINDPSSPLGYEDVPKFRMKDGTEFSLSSAFDFRPILISGSSTGTVPAQGSTAIFDIEYYLPRADILVVNKSGELFIKYGTPADSPQLPNPDPDSMVLYQVFLNAYTYDLNDVRTKFIENKRYTMRDIGRLENRIENLEYYTSLSQLERSAAEANIKDQNGLDKFKNGFLTDNFDEFRSGDLESLEWKAAADRGRKELRPQFTPFSYKLKFNETQSENWIRKGQFVMFPYVDELFAENEFATKHISVNPYFQYNITGTMVLSPNFDVWSDVTRLPETKTEIDTGTEAISKLGTASGLLGTVWGSWATLNTTVVGVNTSSFANSETAGTVTTVTTASNQRREGVETTLESRTQSWSLENIVKDVQILPYIREAVVQFVATGLRPNTRLYAFFDSENVSEFCRDIGFGLTNENAAERLAQISFGSPLYSNEDGQIAGEFKIPGGRFFTGKTFFVLTDDKNNSGDDDIETTTASATYFSGGLDVTKQTETLNLITPVFVEKEVSENRVVTNSTSTTNVTWTKPVPPSRPMTTVFPEKPFINMFPTRQCTCRPCDPVAQQIFVDEDQFISKIDLFFKEIDLTGSRIFVEIRTMANGYPTTTVLARKEYDPSQLNKSEDSTVAFPVVFDIPVYTKKGESYCFVVGGWTPNTRIWVSRLGQEVINMPGKIVETQPSIGSSFRSQNGETWNAEQYEDIKHRIYRARFDSNEMNLVFENDADNDFVMLPENPIETQAGSDMVRIFMRDHGFTKDDRVTLGLIDSLSIKINVSGLPPQIGQYLKTDSGNGYIKTIEKDGTIAGAYVVTMEKLFGKFYAGQNFVADAMVKNLRDNYLVTSLVGEDSAIAKSKQINAAYGTIAEDSGNTIYIGGVIGGIPVEDLNREHIVRYSDNCDSFVVQVTSPATQSGRNGGKQIRIFNPNRKYDLFNVSGSYLPYNCADTWNLSGVGHGDAGSLYESQNYVELNPVTFKVASDHGLVQPQKVSGRNNEIRVFGANGRKSVKVTSKLVSTSSLISPMINADSFSMVGVSNRVEWITKDNFDAIPNASGRFIEETDPILGTGVFKYVTRPVMLSNSASDLVIYFDYYKDVNADFDVYVKTMPVYQQQSFDSYEWRKVNIENKRNSADLLDKVEIKLSCSETVDDWMDGNDYPQFMGFKVKIVGKAKNSSKPPLFYAFRAIAVT